MAVYTNRDAQVITTGQEIGRGGEGAVYQVVGRRDVVAKIYHPAQRTHVRHAKVTAMVTQPPSDQGHTLTPPHVSLAWPTDLLFDGEAFAGFLMPRIERSPTIVALFNPMLRRQRYPHADVRFLYHTGQNLAAVLAALHRQGHVVGDLNQKNILVKPNTLVTLVDTDSFQVKDDNGHCFRCPVGVPDYTPPELQGQSLSDVDRQPCHDCFGLSVLLFQLLMEGYHPFTGRPLQPSLADVEQLSLHCMQQGLFPYSNNDQVQPPPAAPNFVWLPPEIRHLFFQSFLVGYTQPTQRPTAATWTQALRHAEANLVQCHRQPTHWYSNHLDRCPLCSVQSMVAIAKPVSMGGSQPTPAPTPVQPLPPAFPGCLVSLLQVGGGCVLIYFLLSWLVNGLWLILVPALVILLRTPAGKQKLWLAIQISYRGLTTHLHQIGRGALVSYRWLLPHLHRFIRAFLTLWSGSPAIVKDLTAIAILIGFMVAINYFTGTFSIETQPPSPLVVSPLPTPMGR